MDLVGPCVGVEERNVRGFFQHTFQCIISGLSFSNEYDFFTLLRRAHMKHSLTFDLGFSISRAEGFLFCASEAVRCREMASLWLD